MKKALFVFIVLAGLNLKAQVGPIPGGSSTEQMQIMMKMLSLKNSILAKDSVTLSGLLEDDVTYGHTNGLIQTKAQFIRSVMSGEQDYKSIEASDMVVRMYESTGVVTVNLKVVMNYQNSPLELNMKATLVWIKEKNDWKLVARQSVKY